MSPYRVYVTPEALADIKDLPGNIRQRVRQAIKELAQQPYPKHSKQLQLTEKIASCTGFVWITGEYFMLSQNRKVPLMCWQYGNVLPMMMAI